MTVLLSLTIFMQMVSAIMPVADTNPLLGKCAILIRRSSIAPSNCNHLLMPILLVQFTTFILLDYILSTISIETNKLFLYYIYHFLSIFLSMLLQTTKLFYILQGVWNSKLGYIHTIYIHISTYYLLTKYQVVSGHHFTYKVPYARDY